MAESSSAPLERRGLLPEEAAEEGLAEALSTQGRPRRLGRLALAATLATALVAAAALVFLPPRREAARPLGSDIVELVEDPPDHVEDGTVVSIARKSKPGDCIEAVLKDGSPLGQAVKTRPCDARSEQWVLPKTLEGQVTYAGHPEWCMRATKSGRLEVLACADAPAADSEFMLKHGDGKIHVKARDDECWAVDHRSTDSEGRDSVYIQYCDNSGGDSLESLAEDAFEFTVNWPTTTVTTLPTLPDLMEGAGYTTTTEPPTVPHSKLPKKVILKSTHGKYMVAELAGGIFANRDWADNWEKFDLEDLGNGTVALRTYHKKFITVDMLGNLIATSPSITPDAKLRIERNHDGSIAILTAYNRYFCAEPSGLMIANRKDHSSWEHFEVVDMADTWPGHVAVKSHAGKYLRAYPDGSLNADGHWPLDTWEEFQVAHWMSNAVSLRCDHGEYVKVSGTDGLVHVSEDSSLAEKFTVTHLPDGNFTMQSRAGNYLVAKSDGSLVADSATVDSKDPRAHFQVIFVY